MEARPGGGVAEEGGADAWPGQVGRLSHVEIPAQSHDMAAFGDCDGPLGERRASTRIVGVAGVAAVPESDASDIGWSVVAGVVVHLYPDEHRAASDTDDRSRAE